MDDVKAQGEKRDARSVEQGESPRHLYEFDLRTDWWSVGDEIGEIMFLNFLESKYKSS